MCDNPNILLIMTDQQRMDSLSTYGNKVTKTPNLDHLASQSAVFDHMFVTNPVCVPSRASFLTGRYPTAHRCRDLNFPISESEVSLASVLKEHGYDLALIGKNHVFSKAQLETFNSVYLATHLKSKHITNEDIAFDSGVDPCPIEQYPTVQIADQAISYLQIQRENPFFLWVSFPDPHSPYQVPEPYASLYETAQIPNPCFHLDELLTKPKGLQKLREIQNIDNAPLESIKKMISVYYGMITLIDESIGRILTQVRDSGLAESTIVVFTSDHGDYMGDHGLARKSWNFYDCLLRVPFVISWPGVIPARRHAAPLVENVDLVPTLLELCSIEVPHGVQGTSLVPILRGSRGTGKDAVFATIGSPESRMSTEPDVAGGGVPFWKNSAVPGMMIRTREWKLCVYQNGEGELYHLTEDPNEYLNLYGNKSIQAIESQLKGQLLSLRLQVDDPLPPTTTTF